MIINNSYYILSKGKKYLHYITLLSIEKMKENYFLRSKIVNIGTLLMLLLSRYTVLIFM